MKTKKLSTLFYCYCQLMRTDSKSNQAYAMNHYLKQIEKLGYNIEKQGTTYRLISR